GEMLFEDLKKTGSDKSAQVLAGEFAQTLGIKNPDAKDAAPLAATKMVVERPIVKALAKNFENFKESANDALWEKIAALHSDNVRLDESSRALIRSKNPARFDTKINPRGNEELAFAIKNFEQVMAKDTVRNEYLMHLKIHQWLETGAA